MVKRYWKDTFEYQRILEILDDYWLTEEDEYIVEVDMFFKHADGQTQHKSIKWRNMNIDENQSLQLSQKRGSDLVRLSDVPKADADQSQDDSCRHQAIDEQQIEENEMQFGKAQYECSNFNLEELAMYVGISCPTAQRLVNYPGFPALRIGRRWVCPKSAVDKWLIESAKARLEI